MMLGRLQILRFVAAYMVVAYHAFSFLAVDAGLYAPGHGIGAAGVDLFFVISGFIMVHVAAGDTTPGKFMLNRIARIAPLYWLATLAAAAVIITVPWYFWGNEFTWQRLATSLAFLPSLHSDGHFVPILFVGWTLTWEMAFYAMFALSLFAPRAWRLATLTVLILALFTIGRLAIGTESLLKFYGGPILFEFVFGCFIAAAIRTPAISTVLNRLPPWLPITLGVAGLVATAFIPFESDFRALMWGLPATLIVLGVVLLDLNRAPIKPGLLVSLGDSSYSAYLLHTFLVPGLGLVWTRLFGATWLTAPVLIVACFGATIIAAHLSYRLIEIPGRDLMRNLFGLRRSVRPAR